MGAAVGPRDPRDKRVAILGAGAAGLCVAKYFLEAGFRHVKIGRAHV